MERSPTMKNIYQMRHTNAKTQYQFDPNRRLSPQWGGNSRLQPVTQKVKSPPNSKLGSNIWGQQGSYVSARESEQVSYKQAYQRMKQKYAKEAQVWRKDINRRLQLQNAQNNLKLQVMRYKLKSQDVDKKMTERNSKNE